LIIPKHLIRLIKYVPKSLEQCIKETRNCRKVSYVNNLDKVLCDIPEIDRDYKYNRAKFNETIASIIMRETYNKFYFGELYHLLIFHGFNVIQCLSDNTHGVVIGEKVLESKCL